MEMDRARIEEYEADIAALERRIADMEAGRFRHYCEDANSRLLADDTPRMLLVTRASRNMKIAVLAQLRSYVA